MSTESLHGSNSGEAEQRRTAVLRSDLIPWIKNEEAMRVSEFSTFGGGVLAGFETDPVLQEITESRIDRDNGTQERLLLDVVRRSTHNSDYYVRQTGLFTAQRETPPVDEVVFYDGRDYLGLHIMIVGDMKGARRIVMSAFGEKDKQQARDRLTKLGYTYLSREN